MRTLITLTLTLVAACGPNNSPPHCQAKLAPGDLAITEVFARYKPPPGPQWLELHNTTDRTLDLAGLELIHAHVDGSTPKQHRIAHLQLAPHQYATLGDVAPGELPAYLDYGYGKELGELSDAGGKLTARCDGVEIATASYDHVVAGHAREVGEDGIGWCDATTAFEPGNFGTPRQPSDCLAATQCRDGAATRAAVWPEVGQLVITEVMPHPSAAPEATAEWLEVTALADVDLNGLALDRVRDTRAPEKIEAANCLHLAAGQRAIFARSRDATANGGLPPAAIFGTFKLALVAGSPAKPGDVRVLAGPTVIDAVTWTRSTPGAALQLDADATSALANDDPSNWCDATTPYGAGDLGTPGAPNAKCALVPPPGECVDAATGAARPIVKPSLGQLAITEIMPHPHVDPGEEWFELGNVGAAAWDLNELALDRVGDTRPPDIIHAAACKSVPPGGFALAARSADPASNGQLPPVDATFGFTMVDQGGDVRVLDGQTVLDAVTWASSTAGVSQQLVPQSCPGTTPYGDLANLGTPRAPNECMSAP